MNSAISLPRTLKRKKTFEDKLVDLISIEDVDFKKDKAFSKAIFLKTENPKYCKEIIIVEIRKAILEINYSGVELIIEFQKNKFT